MYTIVKPFSQRSTCGFHEPVSHFYESFEATKDIFQLLLFRKYWKKQKFLLLKMILFLRSAYKRCFHIKVRLGTNVVFFESMFKQIFFRKTHFQWKTYLSIFIFDYLWAVHELFHNCIEWFIKISYFDSI